MIKIVKSLKYTSTLTAGDNDIGDKAADFYLIILNCESCTFIITTYEQQVPSRLQKV